MGGWEGTKPQHKNLSKYTVEAALLLMILMYGMLLLMRRISSDHMIYIVFYLICTLFSIYIGEGTM